MFSACGGDGGGGGEPIAPTLSEIESKVFAGSCTFSSCHGETTPREGLSLVAPTFERLVDKPATQAPGRIRVKAGDLDGSYLLEKLTKTKPAMGVRMPQGQAALGASAIQAITEWIRAGAMRN